LIKKIIILTLLLCCKSFAEDQDTKCIVNLIAESGDRFRKDHFYLPEHRTLVVYEQISSSQRNQEVYTDTGRALVNQYEDTFLCTKAATNAERSLPRKVKQLFEKFYSSQPSQKKKDSYLKSIFSSCERSSFTDLKIAVKQKRSQGALYKNGISGSVQED